MPLTQADIWRRIVSPDDGDMPSPLAQYVLGLGFEEADQARMAELSAKANAGTLTPPEREELENFIAVGHLLATLQAKARLSLRRRPAA